MRAQGSSLHSDAGSCPPGPGTLQTGKAGWGRRLDFRSPAPLPAEPTDSSLGPRRVSSSKMIGLLTGRKERGCHLPCFTGSGGQGWPSLLSLELEVFAFFLLGVQRGN